MDQAQIIKNELKKTLDLMITETQAAQLSKYYDLLVEKNKVMNLTRITDFQDAVEKHFADSLAALKFINTTETGKKVLDLGTGAGFPGIPLAVLLPDDQFTLVDSVGKKVDFVREAAEEIGLQNVECVHARAEDLAGNRSYREQYDLCASRAVANLSTLSEYCLPFVKTGGFFAAYKAENSSEEIENAKKAVFILGGSEPEVKTYALYKMERKLVLIRKIKATPHRYPRKAGIPSKKPLS